MFGKSQDFSHPLYARLNKNPPACDLLLKPSTSKVVEADASNLGYEGILKQKIDRNETLALFTFECLELNLACYGLARNYFNRSLCY